MAPAQALPQIPPEPQPGDIAHVEYNQASDSEHNISDDISEDTVEMEDNDQNQQLHDIAADGDHDSNQESENNVNESDHDEQYGRVMSDSEGNGGMVSDDEEPNAQSEEQASDMSNSDEDTEHDRPFYVTSYGRHSKPPSHLNIYECK